MSLNTELLETSFALLRDHKTEFTQHFYHHLFADYPQVKPLFKETQMDKQAAKLFASLVLVVDNLKKTDTLTHALQGLGTRHVKYGVLPEHYPMVGRTLLKAMAIALDEQWTTEFSEAWAEAYATITEIMLDGLEYPAVILDPESALANSPS
ncbi:globin [[Leptolyngbya] sp. PCC 7376]|uniref:globin family protein n=1 Tax=[Leptolyngbya] sp. PCC 7376 TaxID=111781 RepID=UPI00029F3A45|nr:globin family protein [[Leptolyngbya] sp. PCC 7376]AFY37761.1 globin [[Leptolyngbya] sp. PCC 7376]